MSPPFFFQIDEIDQEPDSFFHTDQRGNWKPSVDLGANINYTAGASVSGKIWFCDGQQIYEVLQLPAEALLYKTFSVYYIGGVGFSILRGDARRPPDDDVWHPLQFSYYDTQRFTSYVTNVGQSQTLRLQPQDQRWADLILPNINHTNQLATSQHYGGIVGELPIFLALIAFTTSREWLASVLPRTFVSGAWAPTHAWQMPRIHQRGVVVKVYTCPSTYVPSGFQNWTGSTSRDLYDYEMGTYGKYFY